MTSTQLSEWQKYAELEPFGGHVTDWRVAKLCALLANLWRGPNSPARTIADFMPEDEVEKRREAKRQSLGARTQEGLKRMKAVLHQIHDSAKRRGLTKEK